MVCGFDPDGGLGVAVSDVDVLTDGMLEFEGAAVDATAQLPVCQFGEEAFDLVDPGCYNWGAAEESRTGEPRLSIPGMPGKTVEM